MLNAAELQTINDFHATARAAAMRVGHVNRFDADVIASMCVTALRAGLLTSRHQSGQARQELDGLVDLAEAYADQTITGMAQRNPYSPLDVLI